MNLIYADLITAIEATLPASGKADSLQGELVRLLWGIHREACDNGNANVTEESLLEATFVEENILEADLFNLEERMELRSRFDAIRETMRIAMLADAWGKEEFDEDAEDPTEIAIPVLVADEFYEPIFDALGEFLQANPAPLPLTE